MAAVTYDARREAPREDLAALVAHLRANAARYGIDPDLVSVKDDPRFRKLVETP